MEKLTKSLCEQVDHKLCPDLPPGGCLIEAMPKGRFTNCDFYEFFKERYHLGWFTIEDAAGFLMHHGLHLFVIRDDIPKTIQYITSDRLKAAKGICIRNDGKTMPGSFDYVGNHWHDGFDIEIVGLSFYQISLLVKLVCKAKRIFSIKINSKRRNKMRIFLAALFVFQLKKRIEDQKKSHKLTDWQLSTDQISINEQSEVPILDSHEIIEDNELSIASDEHSEDDEDEENLIWADEDIEYCCEVPSSIRENNFNTMNVCLAQFKGKTPELNCLFNMLKIANSYLELMHQSSELNQDAILFIKKYLHFRHDVFSYLFVKEVIGVVNLFDDESPIPETTSGRTPDFYQRNEEEKTIQIVEFTVVSNKLRANFMKGIDIKTSKYLSEIKELMDLGWQVSYKPIFFSQTDDIASLVNIWESYGYVVSERVLPLLQTFGSLLNMDYNYLFGLGFQTKIHREFPQAEEKISLVDQCSDNWIVKIVSANKTNFYSIINLIRNADLEFNLSYQLVKTKTHNYYLRIVSEKSSLGVSGYTLDQIKFDEGEIYNLYRKQIQGKDKCYIRTRYKYINVDVTPKHGKFVTDSRFDSNTMINNRRNRNLTTLEESQKFDELIMQNTVAGINITCSQDKILDSLKLFSNKLDTYYDSKIMGVQVAINPRRSFLTLIDSGLTTDLEYNLGPTLRSLQIERLHSTVAKVVFSRRSMMKYDSNEVENDDANISLKLKYKEKVSEFYRLLKTDVSDLTEIKFKLALLRSRDPQKLQESKKKMIQAQLDYTRAIDKTTSKGIRLTQDELNLFKTETNWTSNRGYKLYKGKQLDITELIDELKMVNREIHMNFEYPANDFEAPIFKQMKEQCLEELMENHASLKKSNLFNNTVFLARLAYTLLALSNQTFNSKYMKIDNLGLSDVILFVKGGKKITTTRKTKIFKLVYPGLEGLPQWNPNCHYMNNKVFDETPWMQLNQQHLFDMLAAPYKLLANYTSLREKYSSNVSHELVSFPTLLLFHNRRKTEIILHNLRYLCVNPISEYSQVHTMLMEFAAPTYSAFDYAILRGLKENYLKYFETIRSWAQHSSNDIITFEQIKVHHPFLMRRIGNIDDLVYVIYSTYMMTRGAYDQSVEQVVNLKKIMETHQDFMEDSRSHIYDIRSQFDRDSLVNDDFGFCPEACYNVGKFLSAELRNKNASNHLNIKWSNILDEPLDSMASNKGLRYQGKDFFGHKGYYIVYKKILEQNFAQIEDILLSNDLKLIHKQLRSLNETFLTEQSKNDLKQVVMHVVDKSQRGGGREIYVMDFNTKLYQAPIEKLFKVICGFIDNEIISVPSARRAGLIHRKCFEYRSEKFDTYYLTLDCRKWAPRSNPEKYFYMMLGMQDILPTDFFLATTQYFVKHKSKHIKTRSVITDKFFCNPDNDRFKKYFQYNEEESSAFFEMPYSFVMGIFNMLSSLLHAGGQIYAKYLIEKEFLIDKVRADLDMFAHSDDSGGRLSVPKDTDINVVTRLLGNYEFLMKCLNHLMSLKKCNVSKNYFELLSILYINHELLPLLPKFLSNISLNFSGMGMSSDMKQVISKSIELQSNGATHSQAYKCQIILSNLYRNFYRVQTDTQIPAFGGFCNSWPPLYMSFGSSVDEVRSCMYNYSLYSKFMTFAISHLDFDLIDGTISLKYKNVLRFPAAYKKFKKQIELPNIEDSQWFFEQNKTRHSMLNLYWFRAKLESSNFAVSLLNINEVKRAYDSLYMAKGKHIQGKFQTYSINELLIAALQTKAKKTEYEKVLRVMFQGLMRFYSYLEDSNKVFFSKKMPLTVKPCSLQINSFTESPIHDYHSLNLSVQLCRPELMKYTFSNKQYGSELNTMAAYLSKLGVPKDMILTKNFLDYMKKTDNVVINHYSAMPSNLRSGVSFNGLLSLIKHNFHSTLALNTNLSEYLESTKTMVEFNDKFKGLLLCLYFYIIAKSSKNDDLMTININKNLTGGIEQQLSNAYDFVLTNLPYPNSLAFLQLIENREGEKIVLNNFDNWAFWNKKQAKVGDEWIGDGQFTLSLDRRIMTVNIRNQTITSILHKDLEIIKFSEFATVFFFKLIQQFNLNFSHLLTPEEGVSYLSLDGNNQLGLNKGNNAIVGIQNTVCDFTQDFSWAETKVTHNYYNGRHYILQGGINLRLMTIDDLVLSESKLDLFDIVDWDTTTDAAKDVFFKNLTSGEYGEMPNITYVKEQLIESFLDTDIYRFFYDQKRKKKTLVEAFWEDILTHLNYSEDIFPTLYENLGLKQLESILPSSKKDNLALYTFYDNDNEELRTMRYKLRLIETEEERVKFLSNIILTLGDESGLVKLPEVGDPQEFEKYKNENLDSFTWMSVLDALNYSLYLGYQYLSDNSKKEFVKQSDQSISNSDQMMCYLFGWAIMKEEHYYTNYIALTHEQVSMHLLIELIFSEKAAFAEFARSFRRTILQPVPRHPHYEQNWHSIAAELVRYLCCHPISGYEVHLPACLTRFKRLHTTTLEEQQCINYQISDFPGFAISPIVYKTQIAIYTEPQEIRFKDVNEAMLGIFDFSKENAKRNQMYFAEFVEDVWEEEISYKRKKESNKLYFMKSIDHLQDFMNNEVSNENAAYLTNLYMPWLNAKKMTLTTSRHNALTMYAYNFCDKNGKIINSWKTKDKKRYENYIHFYLEDVVMSYPYELDLNQKSVKIDLSVQFNPEIIKQRYDLESQDTYTEDLVNYLCDEFKIPELRTQLIEVTQSKKSAVGKFLTIKQMVNQELDKKKEEGSTINITKLLENYFSNIGELKKGFDLDPGVNVKKNLAKTSRNPDKIIEKVTTNKTEFKQCSTLLDNYLGSILVENMVLNMDDIDHLQTNFRLLRMQFRQQKINNEAAVCNTVVDILGSIKKGTTNTEGQAFCEKMREFLTQLSKSLLKFEEQDSDDDLEKPTTNYVNWKYKRVS